MPNESRHPADHDHAVELHPSAARVGPGYEVRDTRVSAIATFVVGLLITLTLTQFAMWGLLKGISGGKPEAADPLTTPAVVLEQKSALDAAEAAALGGYTRDASAPAGRAGGAVRIPIARAIDLLAERGIPAVPGRPRSEVEVNSHAGGAAPTADRPTAQDRPAPDRRGAPEKGMGK